MSSTRGLSQISKLNWDYAEAADVLLGGRNRADRDFGFRRVETYYPEH